jgi:hypothetical protein
MSESQTIPVAEVLGQVATWPVEERLTLAREILQSVQRDVSETPRPKKSLKALYGALNLGHAPPSDEECERLLEEELLRKYGS